LPYYYNIKKACQQVRHHAEKALSLDETQAEAHASLGLVYAIHDWDWSAAERETRKSIRLKLGVALVHANHASVLNLTERYDEAMKAADEALGLWPEDPVGLLAKGIALMSTDRAPQAIGTLQTGASLYPGSLHFRVFLADAHAIMGERERARALLEESAVLSGRAAVVSGKLAAEYGRCGQPEQSEMILRELEERAQSEYVCPLTFFILHMLLGNMSEATRWLDIAGETHDTTIAWMRIVPWQMMRGPGDSRFKAKAKSRHAFLRYLLNRTIRRHRIAHSESKPAGPRFAVSVRCSPSESNWVATMTPRSSARRESPPSQRATPCFSTTPSDPRWTSSTGHTVLLDNAFRSTLDILESPRFNRVYYNTSLGLISLLEMSGNVPHL
jgi:Flp pilus assembly protein TadD